MKRIWMALLLILCLTFGMTQSVSAETFYGNSDWRVTFTGEKKMESNFRTADLNEAVGGLQPGDNIIFTMNLSNANETATDWYMTNKVLYSLEDRSANGGTSGGAYTYILTYTDKSGVVSTLFSSDTIGGDSVSAAGEGLHAATDALEDFFYLDTLTKGQSGKITLEIALDGETQGNDYQDTLADLQMNFAVELNENPSVTPNDNPRTRSDERTDIVRTGDELRLLPYFLAMGGSGLLLLFLGIYGMKKNRDEKNGRKEAVQHENA